MITVKSKQMCHFWHRKFWLCLRTRKFSTIISQQNHWPLCTRVPPSMMIHPRSTRAPILIARRNYWNDSKVTISTWIPHQNSLNHKRSPQWQHNGVLLFNQKPNKRKTKIKPFHNDLTLIKSQTYVNIWNIKPKKKNLTFIKNWLKTMIFFISLKFGTAIIINWRENGV